MNDLQPYQRPPSFAQLAVMVFAALYWLSPLDFLPFIPFDDVAVILVALLLWNVLGGRHD